MRIARPGPSASSALCLTRLLALVAALSTTAAGAHGYDPQPAKSPRVQIAILLDNSGSMGGLINQARSQLWRIVNEFSAANRRGERIRLELALYEYGNGPVQLIPFTQNLDQVSETLFGLGIRGGDEYCGQVIQLATRELEWSSNPDDLKLIYIAGNEPFTQGPVFYRDAILEAQRRGITVNTIHCGGDEPTWRAGALVAGGNYLSINHNATIAYVPAPQDAEIARLGVQLNRTYVGYGQMGGLGMARQEAQDKAVAAAAPAAAVSRTVAKSSGLYSNSEWDLVDAVKEGKAKAEEVAGSALPPEMQKMSKAERQSYVAAKIKEREQLQKRIAELNAQRSAFLAAQQKGRAGGEATLDSAIIQSVRAQAAKKAISF